MLYRNRFTLIQAKPLKSVSIKLTNICFGLFLSSTVWAQTHSLTYAQVLSKIKAHQQQAETFSTQTQIANAKLKQSQLWKNPNFAISQTGFKNNEDRETEISISQELDIFGQRRALKQLATLDLSQVKLAEQQYKAEFELATSYLWTQVALQQEELILNQNQLVISQATLDAAQLRYKAGSVAKLDYERALITHIQNQRTVQQVEMVLSTRKKQLANYWGETQSDFIVQFGQSIWPSDTQDFIVNTQQNNVYQKNLALQQQRQFATERYLQVVNRPNPTVSLGVVRTKALDVNDTENQIKLGVDIPLNIFNRQQYSKQIIAAKQQLLDRQKVFYQSQNNAQLDTLISEIKALKQQYDLTSEQQIPLAEAVYQKTLLGFKVGKYGLTDVQQANSQLQEIQLNKIQLLKQAWDKSFEAKSLAIGIDPIVILSSNAIQQINQNLWQSTQELNNVAGAE